MHHLAVAQSTVCKSKVCKLTVDTLCYYWVTMPTIELKAEVSVDALLAGVEQLPTPYLEDFVAKALAVQAKRRAKSLNKGESLLLEKINRGIPDTIHARYKELEQKRRDETLLADEHQELLALITQIEQMNAERIGYLGELAQMRNVSLRSLMKELGINRPAYA